MVLCFFIVPDSYAQENRPQPRRKPTPTDSSAVVPDSLKKLKSSAPNGIIDPIPQDVAVNFSSKDSLLFRLKGDRRATLFGASKVEHTSGSLKSGVIGVNFNTHVMNAETSNIEDTLSHPVLTREADELRSRRILFNYKTERGKFNVARMNYSEGNLIGTEVKNKTQHVVFIGDGIYSTCSLDHPHYYIKADKMKVVDEEEIFFTNARLYLLDIPYPLILPFGYVPADLDKKKSGLLAPTYAFQTQSAQGLGIQNLGWFQYFNDYFTGKLAMSLYTSGTMNADIDANYKYRDDLSGSIKFGYSRLQGLESTDPNYSQSITNSFSIRHNQSINPYSKLDANVTLRSAQYNRNTSFDIEERAEISTTSAIGFQSRDPNGLYNYSIRANHSQNFANNTVTLSGPSASLGFRSFTPFQNKSGQTGSAGPLESMTINVSSSLTSSYQFRPIDADSASINWFEALLSPSKFREATGEKIPVKWGASHQVSLSSKLIPSDVIQVNGSASYREYWHPYTIRQYYDTTLKKTDFRVVNEFASARDFNLSVGANTTVYGIANVNMGKLKSFRHTVQPSLSFSYQPNFQSDFWGYYRTYNQPTSDTTSITVPYSIYQQGVAGTGFGTESRSINFSVNNVLETKLVSRDTLGEKKEKIIKLIDSWNFSTSYNFMAKQFKLSDLTTRISSSIINNINLNANANFSFYATDTNGVIVDRYLWDARKKPFRLTSFQFSTGTRFSEGSMSAPRNQSYYYPEFYDPYNQQEFWPENPMYYSMDEIDYSVPWSVNLNFSYSWRKSNNRLTRSAILNASSIQFRPSEKWNISTTMGYDFILKKLTPNQIRVSRNIHCWDMSFIWNPFSPSGQTYYLFRLTVNSAQFQSLFQKLPGLNNLERSSSRIPTRPFGF
ncbi:LPS-assembly protein LptD [bacterium]|nr:MAG: LPS-assembly protein LptD [bacterium]